MILISSPGIERCIRSMSLQLQSPLDILYYDADALEVTWPEIKRSLDDGEDLLFIGLRGLEFLRALWMDSEEPEPVKGVRLYGEDLSGGSAARWSFRPPERYALHGIHEEPRVRVDAFADVLDTYGQPSGACGIRCRNVAKSLSGGHYEGALWLALAIDASMVTNTALAAMVAEMANASKGAYIAEFLPEFAWFHKGERVRMDVRVSNRTQQLLAAELDIALSTENGVDEDRVHYPLMLNGRDGQDVCFYFYPQRSGTYTVRASLELKSKWKYGHEREKPGMLVDERHALFRVEGKRIVPDVRIEEGKLCVGDETGFLMGTHLYPSTTFFEASYRPVRLELVQTAAAEMKRTGIRLCRLWCDPLLDETSLRGMRAMIEVLGENGIAAIVTLFTSWTRKMRVQTARRRSEFLTADMQDDALIGVWLKDMECQCRYVREVAEMFSDLPNVLFDLSNEFTVVDPSEAQMDRSVYDSCRETGVRRNVELFRLWARRLREAMREAGARQLLYFGVNCWDTGADNYLCNYGADLMPTHLYCEPDRMRYLAAYTHPGLSGQPFLLEEFGGPWADDKKRAQEYLRRYFEIYAVGFQGAVNYEWGVLWTSNELPGTPPYMKFNSDIPDSELKGFHYEGRRAYAKTWTKGSTGICPWIASTEYGINRPCLPGETRTMRVMKQFKRLTERLDPVENRSSLAVVVPFEVEAWRQGVGYARRHRRLDALLDRLWSVGASFMLCQETDIAKLPEIVEEVLYPNECPISASVAKALSALEERGVRVRTGEEAEDYRPGIGKGIRLDAAVPVRIQDRFDGRNRCVSLFSEHRAAIAVDSIRLVFEGNAMLWLETGSLKAAAFWGALYDGPEMRLESTMCVGMRIDGDGWTLLPFAEGDINLGKSVVVQVGGEGDPKATMHVSDGRLHIDSDESGYAYRILSE